MISQLTHNYTIIIHNHDVSLGLFALILLRCLHLVESIHASVWCPLSLSVCLFWHVFKPTHRGAAFITMAHVHDDQLHLFIIHI